MKYKLIIFDFDGTLADTFPWFMNKADILADKFKFKRLDMENLEQLRWLDAKQMIKQHGVSLWKLPLIANFIQKELAKDIQHINLFKGMDLLLERLAQAGARLVVVTSNSKDNVHQVLGSKNAALFSDFECGVSVFGKQGKFRKMLRKYGLQPGEAICIGDEIRDIQAAKKAHIPSGVVSWGYTSVQALLALAPDEVFFNVEEIFEKIV